MVSTVGAPPIARRLVVFREADFGTSRALMVAMVRPGLITGKLTHERQNAARVVGMTVAAVGSSQQ
jgi:hypothetical protein